MGFIIKKTSKITIGLLFLLIIATIPIKFATADTMPPFIVATANGPGKLDPLDAYDSESKETIMQVVEGLYIHNYSSAEMEVIPCLAASLGVWSPDAKNLTIVLKQGVTFHDGSKFNASSVKWNFDRLQYWTYGFDIDNDGDLDVQPMGTASMTLFKIGDTVILNRTEILNEYTIKFVLNLPCIIWEKLLAFVACSIVKPDVVFGIPYMEDTFFNRITVNDPLIGTGPFKLTEYDLDNQVEFDWNSDYHITWGSNHIEKMIYLIIPDDVTSSLAVLSHAIHWGGVLSEYQDQFDADPDLVQVRKKGNVVYYQQMNLYNMHRDIRYATTFAWNHTYWLEETLGGNHFELHVPVPDGMQYHHSGFDGEPYYDIDTARDILLNSADTAIQANLTVNGLTALSTNADWRDAADSVTPVAWFNYTRYQSGTVNLASLQLQDNLKDIGIRLEILPAIDWSEWVMHPIDPHNLAYSFSGWGPNYNDPIDMIEPLYGANASANCFGLDNATWNQKLIDTYSTTGLARRALFYEIQEDFCKIHVPSMYILQLGESINFNKNFIDENSVGDLLNIVGDLFWFNLQLNAIQERPTITNSPPFTTEVSVGYSWVNLSWTAVATSPATYTISLSGFGLVQNSTSWVSGIPITYYIPNGLSPGEYLYTIRFWDDDGYSDYDTVRFVVTAVDPPFFTDTPNSLFAEVGYSDQSFTWTATDNNPTFYTISLLDEGVVAGPTSWSSGDPIIFDIPDGMGIGTYRYTIRIEDELGNFVEDVVYFTVKEREDSPFTIPGFSTVWILIISAFTIVFIGLLSKRKKQF